MGGGVFVGQSGVVAVEAVAQGLLLLDSAAELQVAVLGAGGVFGAAQLAQGEAALVVAFFGLAVDAEELVGGGERAGGTGLGLYTCELLARQLGATLTIERPDDGGVRAELRLPS